MLHNARFVWTTALILFASGQLNAGFISDQSNTTTGLQGNITDEIFLAQTFTVGIDGTLARIDAMLRQDEVSPVPVQLTIFSTAAGLPSVALGTATVPGSSLPTSFGFVSFDILSANISVSAGDILAYALSTPSNSIGANWLGDPTGAYAGGDALRSLDGGSSWSVFRIGNQPVDLTFRTFVSPVPEPASIALWTLGFFGLAFGRRRRPR